jgi:aminomuconate-semialdehyde/2-hydroxymuconate-6-semialdehyde dehydrogenase
MNIRFFADYALERLSHPDFETRGHTQPRLLGPGRRRRRSSPRGTRRSCSPPGASARRSPRATPWSLKPPEWAPLTASLFADIAHEAGPAGGRVQRRPGLRRRGGRPARGAPRRRRICFTGSVPTSKVIGEAAARNVTPVSFELGGKSPARVLDDADLDLAVDLAVEQFDNSGQVCLAAPDAGAGRHRRRVPRALPRARRADHAGRPARRGDTTSARSSTSHFERVEPASSSARSPTARGRPRRRPNTELGRRLLLPPHGVRGRRPGQRDPLPGGLRPGAHDADGSARTRRA